jgi:hypothetical protein
MNKRRTKILDALCAVWILLTALAVGSCQGASEEVEQAELEAEASPILVRAVSEGNEDDSSSTTDQVSPLDHPTFVFWLATDYDKTDWTKAPDEAPELYLVAKAGEQVDSYEESPYNTGGLYPKSNAGLYASGYAPADWLEPNDSYSSLSIKGLTADNVGTWDIYVASNTLYGSSKNPFDAQDAERMKFIHAQSKLTITAQLQEKMRKYVRNVKITIPAVTTSDESNGVGGVGQLMKGLILKPDGSGQSYVADCWLSTDTDAKDFHSNAKNTLLYKEDETVIIPEVFIMPGLYGIKMHVYAELRDAVNSTTFEKLDQDVYVDFTGLDRSSEEDVKAGRSDSRLYAGESYKITLLFADDVLEAAGMKMLWQNGGQISVPIYPNLEKTTEENSEGETAENGTSGGEDSEEGTSEGGTSEGENDGGASEGGASEGTSENGTIEETTGE